MASTAGALPKSTMWEIRETPTAGRAVFALQPLQAGTRILSTAQISASVILRVYKREVCVHCSHYIQGDKLPYRVQATGLYFCTRKCQDVWEDETGELGIEAWEKIEDFVRAKNLKKANVEPVACEMPDADAAVPTVEAIRKSWESVESTAHFIREARGGSKMKPHRRAVESVLNVNPNADLLAFQLSGILSRAKEHQAGWDGLMSLVPDATPYKNNEDLRSHIQSYLHLLCLAPLPLLTHITPTTLLSLSERDSHNSFGIRSLDDGGDEFFGYGVWPEASFFNHSCRPNVSKKRDGRSWVFWVEKAVEAGEELCISYLGGDEVGMAIKERRKMTMEVWSFECGCPRCLDESVEGMEGVVKDGKDGGLGKGALIKMDKMGNIDGSDEISRINWMNGFSGMITSGH